MTRTWLTLIISIISLTLNAQRQEILSPNIATLQVTAGDDPLGMPVINLGQQTPIVISFDDLTHQYRRYTYKLEHCEADWTTSDGLFESDYCIGFASGNTIEQSEQSTGTNQLYTHYRLEIPNAQCQLKMSGNYRVTVYDENDDSRPMLKAHFMVVEPGMAIGLQTTTNTDLDINGRYQQVEMKLNYGSLRVTDPSTQIKTVVLQNGRWHTAVTNPTPQFIRPDGLAWSHNRQLIFDGGNEYRKFEMLDVTHPTLGIENINWDGEAYHAYVWPDQPRPAYVYDEDADGAFVIRNSDNYENDTHSEYLYAHFTLQAPRMPGEIYINAAWTNDQLLPEYRMQWNADTQNYEASVWLKQGYYSYQYLLLTTDGRLVPLPSEGNFYQTQNRYQAFVYYRAPGERTDRLVAYTVID